MKTRLSIFCGAMLIGHLHFHAVAQAASPKAANNSSRNDVPRLVLKWDCGDCEQNEKVLPLINQEYAKEAHARGYSVSTTESAELSITAYRQRKPGARVMLGIFAGKDVLRTRIRFRGKEYVAKDYSANIFAGMNSLCAAVARKAVKQLGPVAAR